MKDRTDEFFSTAELLRRKLDDHVPTIQPPATRTELVVESRALAQQIRSSFSKIQQLKQLATVKSQFANPSGRIRELTTTAQADCARQESQLKSFMATVRKQATATRHHRELWDNVAKNLQQHLLQNTRLFEASLTSRKEAIQSQQQWASRVGFTAWQPDSQASASPLFTPLSAAVPAPNGTKGSTLFPPPPSAGGGLRRRGAAAVGSAAMANACSADGDSRDSPATVCVDGMSTPLAGGGGGGFMTSSMALQRSRAEDARRVEDALASLAPMMSRIPEIVAQQGETIERIEDDLQHSSDFVQKGQTQLLLYLEEISNNRGMIVKTFLMLIFIIILLTLFKV